MPRAAGFWGICGMHGFQVVVRREKQLARGWDREWRASPFAAGKSLVKRDHSSKAGEDPALWCWHTAREDQWLDRGWLAHVSLCCAEEMVHFPNALRDQDCLEGPFQAPLWTVFISFFERVLVEKSSQYCSPNRKRERWHLDLCSHASPQHWLCMERKIAVWGKSWWEFYTVFLLPHVRFMTFMKTKMVSHLKI